MHEIITNFDKASETYEKFGSVQQEAAEITFEMLKKSNFCPHFTLELGCGPGNYTKMIAKGFPNSNILAIDASEKMIKLAQKNANFTNTKYLVGNAENVDEIVKEQKFDLITSNATFQWIHEKNILFQKLKQILNRSGIMLFSSFGPKTFCELDFALNKLDFAIEIPSQGFADELIYKKLINEIFKNSGLEITKKFITKKYENLFELLKTIKQTGTQGQKNKLIWTKNKILKLEEFYLKSFGEIIATYEIIFVKCSIS